MWPGHKKSDKTNQSISKSVVVCLGALTQCFDSDLPCHWRWNMNANEVDVLVQQDIIGSAGVKRDAEFLCQAARFLFASPPECMNLEAFGLQQRDQHAGCAPCAKHTDSWQHGSAARSLWPYVWTMASATDIPQICVWATCMSTHFTVVWESMGEFTCRNK